MLKKLIPVAIAIVLIFVIAFTWLLPEMKDHYEYSTVQADLNEYYEIYSLTDVPIMLQDELIEERGQMIDGVVYLDMSTIQKYFVDRFYYNEAEKVLKYTTMEAVTNVYLDERNTSYETSGVVTDVGYPIALVQNDTLYIALDYIKLYDNFSYELFTNPNRMQIYTQWGTVTKATVNADTQVRTLGGIKCDILEEVKKGDELYVLEQMETWTKVKTNHAIIGYVETKRLDNIRQEEQTPVTDVKEVEYTSIVNDDTVSLAFHYVGHLSANDELKSLVADAEGLNTVSPTWFFLNDNEGNFLDLGSASYVKTAHDLGLDVWALIEDITYSVDLYEILASTENRTRLIQNLINAAENYGLDGINIDFESVNGTEGPHFVQFLRELSIETHARGIVLSVDNYMPNAGNTHYNYKEQGLVADYVVLMGYDEHWAGCGTAGSVASIQFVKEGIQNTINKGVPQEKVINALPFYTRVWETVGDKVTDTTDGMINIENWAKKKGLEFTWDEETCQYYGELKQGDTLYQVWMEEEESISAKLNVMLTFDLGGVAGWRLGYEKSSVWPLLKGYVQANNL